jgi:hypothetical protein
MPLVTSRDFNLTPDISPLTRQIGAALQQRAINERQDQQIAQKAAIVKEKDNSLMVANQASRIRNIKDPTSKRTEIARLAQEEIKAGRDGSMWANLLNETKPDQLNLELTRIFTAKGNQAELFKKALSAADKQKQFEPIKDAEGNIIAQRNVQTGEVIKDPRAGLRTKERDKALKDDLKLTKDSFERSSKLRSEIAKISVDFNKQRGAWARVEASAKDPSPAGDLALIFNFMKVLDPGSTVREGEFAQVGAAGNLPTQAQRVYEQWATGQKLTTSQRKDVVDRARKIFVSAESLNKKDIKQIISIGKQFGIKKSLLLGAELEEQPEETANELSEEEQAELDQLRQRFGK